MTTDSQDPRISKSPGEPNSDSEQELSSKQEIQAADTAPHSPEESADYISEIRHTLVSEESTHAKRQTGSLFKRITQTLRRVTGTLREPEQGKSELGEPLPETPPSEPLRSTPTGRLEREEETEVSDELLTGRLGNVSQGITDGPYTGRLDSTAVPETLPDELLTGRLGAAPAAEPDNLHTGRLGKGEDSEIPDSLLTGRLGPAREDEFPDNLLTGRLGPAQEDEISDNLLTGRLGPAQVDQIPDNLLTGRLGQAPATEEPDSSLLTGKLAVTPEAETPGDMLTGRLGEEPQAENPDNLLTGRLGDAHEDEIPDSLLTGRLGQGPETEEVSDNLLTGRLGDDPRPERPGDLVTRRLDDAEIEAEFSEQVLTGKLSLEPGIEPDLPDNLLTGRLSNLEDEEHSNSLITGPLDLGDETEIPDRMVTRLLDEVPDISDQLITDRTGSKETDDAAGVAEDLFSEEPFGEGFRPEAPGAMGTRQLDEDDLDDEFFAGRLGTQQKPAMPENLVTRPLEEETSADIDGHLLADQPDSEPKTGIPGNLVTHRLDDAPEVEISDPGVTGRLDLEMKTEIAEGLSTGRLGSEPDTQITEELSTSRLDSARFEEPSVDIWSDRTNAGSEAAELLEMEETAPRSAEVEPEDILEGEDPITLLESGAIAALGLAEEEAALQEDDWMKAIRQETSQDAERDSTLDGSLDSIETAEAGTEAWSEHPVEPPTPRGVTQPLRNFFTGIFGKPGERGRREGESEIPDEMVNGRLERSLGVEAGRTPLDQPGEEDLFAPADTQAVTGITDQSQQDELMAAGYEETLEVQETGTSDSRQTPPQQEDFFQGLEVKFSKATEAGSDLSGYDLYPEDEALLWGTTNQETAEPVSPDVPVSPEDIWGRGTDSTGYGADLRQEIWGDGSEEKVLPSNEDQYAATYLTGEDYLPAINSETKDDQSQEELLGTILGQRSGSEENDSVEDIRAIALEDYEEGEMDYSAYSYKIDWGDEQTDAQEEWVGANNEQVEQLEQAADYETRKALSTDFKSWLANRKTSHKILLAEAVIVVLVLIVAIPYFIFMILRGQAAPPVETQPVVAVSDLPHPTGLTLPGGWYFPLERSTIINGEWQPKTNEWLEGSEVRRVVALPWNQQTEAVVKTFQVGDGVALYMSNGDTQTYRVFSIDQVAVSNTQIYSDTNASLAIILYKGKDSTRWVIICKP